MSWGERSCVKPCRSLNCSYETCNVDCPHYIWDRVTKPDSISKYRKLEQKKSETKKESKIKPSVLKYWSHARFRKEAFKRDITVAEFKRLIKTGEV